MSAPNSIEIESLSKRYLLGERESTGQIREQVVKLFKRGTSRQRAILWALRDVSFAVPQGQVVGIIGRNGAGKSTLLKVLSRITHPTEGTIRVRGRVASLLEVGTGFHDELTGRENIYLNGSILGMRRREIDRHFDAIVEFSGLSQFIDTPIKRFSSGMRLRLGFAVAAHLDPDVLIVDEVLAVGDVGFQKKCIAAMEDLRSGGRTVLFVSHNMAAVENLCSRGIWIDSGKVRLDGPATDVIKSYLSSFGNAAAGSAELDCEGRVGTGEVRITRVELLTTAEAPCATIRSGDGFILRMHYRAHHPVRRPNFVLRLSSTMGTVITETSFWHHGGECPSLAPGEGHVEVRISQANLVAGQYHVSFAITDMDSPAAYDGEVRMRLDVEPADVYGSGRAPDGHWGIVYFPHRWIFCK